MFFKKRHAGTDISSFIACVARFFSLPEQKVSGWFMPENGGLVLTLPFACLSQHQALSLALQKLDGGDKIQIRQSIAFGGDAKRGHRSIRNLLAVASGKGGVGKSTTTINLAMALVAEGARVGILDADIYGPSIPIMLGNAGEHPESSDNRHMQPLRAHGLVANSIGYLVPADDAAVWRGPMASKALQQLLNETLWPQLDYLLIDMPPGTGDIQLTLAQQVPVSGALVVTTPQNIALADAQKAIAMFNKVKVPVLGVLENMSYHQCENCGHKEFLFAQGGGERISGQNKVPLLGHIPLDIHIREYTDAGKALIVDKPQSAISQAYGAAARQLAKQLYISGQDKAQAIDISIKEAD
ncbi:iron-sulfur cluster carrier protein ApbC [Bowmanella yangjiangensis]|uniref:iron-sulfur cluster carrier protein ApbC n=1 Tax=Bowmanella yangjiangensis TaxID=2811230 RepID=UPI001E542928|nr:iron-sulfur cluster carrier protein ApbC [Bowmanella yangjiangensis]